jgi:hypothetical protein
MSEICFKLIQKSEEVVEEYKISLKLIIREAGQWVHESLLCSFSNIIH